MHTNTPNRVLSNPAAVPQYTNLCKVCGKAQSTAFSSPLKRCKQCWSYYHSDCQPGNSIKSKKWKCSRCINPRGHALNAPSKRPFMDDTPTNRTFSLDHDSKRIRKEDSPVEPVMQSIEPQETENPKPMDDSVPTRSPSPAYETNLMYKDIMTSSPEAKDNQDSLSEYSEIGEVSFKMDGTAVVTYAKPEYDPDYVAPASPRDRSSSPLFVQEEEQDEREEQRRAEEAMRAYVGHLESEVRRLTELNKQSEAEKLEALETVERQKELLAIYETRNGLLEQERNCFQYQLTALEEENVRLQDETMSLTDELLALSQQLSKSPPPTETAPASETPYLPIAHRDVLTGLPFGKTAFDLEATKRAIAQRASRKETTGDLLGSVRSERGDHPHMERLRWRSQSLPAAGALVSTGTTRQMVAVEVPRARKYISDDDYEETEGDASGEDEKESEMVNWGGESESEDEWIDNRRVQESFVEALGVPEAAIPVLDEGNRLSYRDGTKDSKGRLHRRKQTFKVGKNVAGSLW